MQNTRTALFEGSIATDPNYLRPSEDVLRRRQLPGHQADLFKYFNIQTFLPVWFSFLCSVLHVHK